MRHAKSDWQSGVSDDFHRPLSRRGSKDAPRMGRWLTQQGLSPIDIISSPATRARQTAELLVRALGKKTPLSWESSLYDADPGAILEVISSAAVDGRSLLIVGHNPGLDGVLVHLCRTAPVRDAKGKLLTTAALAVLDYGTGRISAARHSADIETLLRPKELH